MKKKLKPDSDNNRIIFSTDSSYSFANNELPIDTLPEAQQKLIIKLDTKKRAGKSVTLIQGFIGKNEDLEQLGKNLKNFCGTGGSVKEAEIIVQGDHCEKVLSWLHKNGYVKAVKR